MRFLIIFIFLITNSFANENPNIKNLIISKEPVKHASLTFLDSANKQITLDDYVGNLIILNFWATWCAPCREEMPSLDQLMINSSLENLKIFPINVGNDNFIGLCGDIFTNGRFDGAIKSGISIANKLIENEF